MPTVDGAPPIAGFDDLMTEQEVLDMFGISRSTLMKWRYGRDNKPEMPYIRLNNRIFISKQQLAWWLNEVQKSVDPYHYKFRNRNIKGLKHAGKA